MGKPIIAYSIEAALQSGLFEEVMVSTDDEEIAGIACKYGAKVPFMRSAEMSNDYAGTDDVILEVLRKYKEQGREFETVCCIYSTAPLSLPKDSGKHTENEFGDRFRFHLCGLFLSYTAQPSHRGWKN